MRRQLLLAGMFVVCVISALVLGIGWARHAPAFPAVMRTISPGMTIAEVEARLGQRVVGTRACTAVDYFIQVPDHWWFGKVAYLYLSAPPRPQDTMDAPIIDGGDLVCRQVDFYCFPKLDSLSRQPWAYDLIYPDE